jgi:PhnB protein
MKTNTEIKSVVFAPVLFFKNVAVAIEFYTRAFGARELRRRSNDDDSVHVAEMIIGDAIFHLHEEVVRAVEFSPETLGGTPIVIGLFVEDPDALMKQAVDAGAVETSAMQDYDYGYRQGSITDPFEHHWTLQRKLNNNS